ncbi:hypothetical protein [Burkholderia cepacia]|nr:hypothetical protein [Burkholderia cepacia]MCA8471488.1 hypothetical protein [Burkholderia cepacia]MDN7767836.1 hypothetical protein [Burkholderia cepacia]QCY01679.1 hypothetical protein EJ998_00215 [Burkholderia cepacia ATCC 25416]
MALDHGESREHSSHHLLHSGKSLPNKAFGLIRMVECMALTCPKHSDSTGWAYRLSTCGTSASART